MNPAQPASDPRTERHRAVLDELVDMGMQLARALHARAMREAEATPPLTPVPNAPASPVDPTLQFDRITRAIRRTVLMARSLDTTPDTAQATARALARRRLIRIVENNIGRNAASPAAAEALRREFAERLDAPELDEEIDARPIRDVISDVIDDLGLDHCPDKWTRRTPADITRICQQAAKTPTKKANPLLPLPQKENRGERPLLPPRGEGRGEGPTARSEPTAFSLSPRERAGVRAPPPEPTQPDS